MKDSLFVANGYSIDLQTLKIFKDGKDIKELGEKITSSIAYKTLFGNKPFPYVMENGFAYRYPDKSIRIFFKENPVKGIEIRIQKIINAGGRDHGMNLLMITKKSILSKFLSLFSKKNITAGWLLRDLLHCLSRTKKISLVSSK